MKLKEGDVGIHSFAWNENKKDLMAYDMKGRRLRFVNAQYVDQADGLVTMKYDKVIDDTTGQEITE